MPRPRTCPAGPSICFRCGFSVARFAPAIHGDQSLRNHSVGSRCRSAASGPRLVAEIFTRMSSAAPLAYSTNTSKYRSSLKTPVSSSSYSISWRERWPFVRDKIAVGIRRLRVLVEIFHVRVRGRAIEVEVVLLHVLAVVALAVGEPEEALLEDRILAVPQREAEAEALLVVGDAGDAVFAPAVGARAGVIVGEEVPGVARLAVVLAHRAPLAFAQVRPPLLPGGGAGAGFFQSNVFLRRRHGELLWVPILAC